MDIGLYADYKNKAFLRFGSEPDCNSLQTFRLKTGFGLDNGKYCGVFVYFVTFLDFVWTSIVKELYTYFKLPCLYRIPRAIRDQFDKSTKIQTWSFQIHPDSDLNLETSFQFMYNPKLFQGYASLNQSIKLSTQVTLGSSKHRYAHHSVMMLSSNFATTMLCRRVRAEPPTSGWTLAQTATKIPH